jgi:hypothetical protein
MGHFGWINMSKTFGPGLNVGRPIWALESSFSKFAYKKKRTVLDNGMNEGLNSERIIVMGPTVVSNFGIAGSSTRSHEILGWIPTVGR